MSLSGLSKKVLRVLETGPRKLNVLRGLAKSTADLERAIGQLFIVGMVKWAGAKKGRLLARKA